MNTTPSNAVDGLLDRWLAATGDDSVIPIVDRSKLIRVSHAQRGLWLAHHIGDEANTCYVVRHPYRLRGPLNIDALRVALDGLLARHEILRTTFTTTLDGELMQRIGPPVPVRLRPEPLPGSSLAEREQALDAVIANAVREPMDLERGPLLRARLFTLDDQDQVLLLVIHHIANDAWSMGVLHQELAELYEAAVEGRPPRLPELVVQYADFAEWQRAEQDRGAFNAGLRFWREQLRGAPTLLAMPTDRPRPAVQSFRGGWVPFTVPADVAAGVDTFAKQADATRFMVLLAAFQLVLARWSGQHDLLVGTGVSLRPLPETEMMIGPFTNILPMRLAVEDDMSFVDLLAGSRQALLAARRHENVPFEVVVDELGIARNPGYNPLIQVAVSSHQGLMEPLRLTGLRVEYLPVADVDAQRDLTLFIAADADMAGTLSYATDLFDRRTVERLLADYLTALERAVRQPTIRCAEIPLLGPERSATRPGAPMSSPPALAATPLLPLVRRVWTEVLERGQVGPEDDFFLLGGSSMAAMRVCARLTHELGIRVPVRALFNNSRLDHFAERVYGIATEHLGPGTRTSRD